jgi:FG-GAP-like repeat
VNGTTVASAAGVGKIPTNWSVVGTGDFNGDGMSDIVWRDDSGNTAIWLMRGASVLSFGGLGNVPINWTLSLVGDFDGDGKSDLLWRDTNEVSWNGTSGDTSIWFMNGTTINSAGSVGKVSTTWTVQSVNAE